MLDDELRALERAATDTVSRIRYAEALARVGRVEDAVEFLEPFADAVAPYAEPRMVRHVMARLPAPPLPDAPPRRTVWHYLVPDQPSRRLLVSPLLVVVAYPTFFRSFRAHDGCDLSVGGRRLAVGVAGSVVVARTVAEKLPRLVGSDAYELSDVWSLAAGDEEWLDGCRLVLRFAKTYLVYELQPEGPPRELGECDAPPPRSVPATTEARWGSRLFGLAGNRLYCRKP